MSGQSKILLVAGEASADLHASALLGALRELEPGITCFGVGGRELARAGMEIVVPAESLSVVGIADWMERWPEVLGSYRKVCEVAKDRKPDCAVLLDLPDFNLRLARQLHAAGIPVVYYISPQVWAWRRYRVRKIRRFVDRMLVVFPFEKDFYRRHAVDAEFVGHPLLERIEARRVFRSRAEVASAPRIALLPGSRRSELRHHAPLLAEVLPKIRARFPKAQFRLPVASTLSREAVRAAVSDPSVEIVDVPAIEVLAWADSALVASGTATLETALVGTPFALYYIMSATSGWVVKHLLRYQGFYGMANLLHGREVVREFIQHNATAENLAEETLRLLEDENYRRVMADQLLQCRDLLGRPGASTRAAREVQAVLRKRQVGTC